MKLSRIGHVALWVSDQERSKSFYSNTLGLRLSEEDPEHGGAFMALGNNFHTIDVFPSSSGQSGLAHIAFQVESYDELREVYRSLIANGVEIDRATDHVSQRSIYFTDPDGIRLEVYYEMPDAVDRFSTIGRGDDDRQLPVSGAGEPIPAWLDEDWPTND